RVGEAARARAGGAGGGAGAPRPAAADRQPAGVPGAGAQRHVPPGGAGGAAPVGGAGRAGRRGRLRRAGLAGGAGAVLRRVRRDRHRAGRPRPGPAAHRRAAGPVAGTADLRRPGRRPRLGYQRRGGPGRQRRGRRGGDHRHRRQPAVTFRGFVTGPAAACVTCRKPPLSTGRGLRTVAGVSHARLTLCRRRELTPAQLEEIAAYAAGCNRDPAQHIGYVGQTREEVTHEPGALDAGPVFAVPPARDDRLCGLLAAEWDVDLGRTWLHGPWAATPDLMDRLYRAVLPHLPVTAGTHELFIDTANTAVAG